MNVPMQAAPQTDGALTLCRFPFAAKGVAVGDTVVGVAVLLDREDKQTRAGKPMATFTLRNATGVAAMPVWSEGLPAVAGLAAGMPVLLTATWASGRGGTAEWKFEAAEALPENHPVVLEAQPVAPLTLEQLRVRTAPMLAVLSADARKLHDVLLYTPVVWPDGSLEPMRDRFVQAPAATANHHATIRGLLFHSVQVTGLALVTAQELRRTGDAPDLDLDAVVLGAFWHDLGKLDELSWRGSFKYTARAAGATHMGWGLCRVTEAVTRAETTTGWQPTTRQRELIDHLLHIVASHHGQKDWGALVEPMSREAWCVSTADQLSAKAQPITDTAGTGVPLAAGYDRVGSGWAGRTQFISPSASRPSIKSGEEGVLRLVLPDAEQETTDAA